MAMYRAVHRQKLALDYEISFYRMQENLENFSLYSMQEQESMHFYTIVARRIIELHSVIGHLRMYGRKNTEVSRFLLLLQHETEKTENLASIRIAKPEVMIENEVKNLNQLKSKSKKLLMRLNCLKEKFEENKEKIDENIRKSSESNEFDHEIKDYRLYRNFLDSSNKFLLKKRHFLSQNLGSFSTNFTGIPQSLFVLSQSRQLAEEYRSKLELLRERINNKIIECVNKHDDFHSKIMNQKSDYYITK